MTVVSWEQATVHEDLKPVTSQHFCKLGYYGPRSCAGCNHGNERVSMLIPAVRGKVSVRGNVYWQLREIFIYICGKCFCCFGLRPTIGVGEKNVACWKTLKKEKKQKRASGAFQWWGKLEKNSCNLSCNSSQWNSSFNYLQRKLCGRAPGAVAKQFMFTHTILKKASRYY